MTKERPTHLCNLEIDPRDPSAIIQAQADRIAELEEVLDRMRRDGCGNASPIRSGEFETCREKFPGEPDEWCWSCQAHEALN